MPYRHNPLPHHNTPVPILKMERGCCGKRRKYYLSRLKTIRTNTVCAVAREGESA